MRRVLVVGGGFAGLTAALRLQRRLAATGDELVLVNPENFMVYHPLLPEAASGSIEPRHVVVPLRPVLRYTAVVTGEVERLDHPRRVAHVRTVDGEEQELPYDLVVLCPGSVSRVAPVPGLAGRAVGFRTLQEAIHLRNHVLSRLEVASVTRDPARRRAALTFVVVGGGYAGVEALAELLDMARDALRHYPGLRPSDLQWVLVDAAPRILPELSPRLAARAAAELGARGVEVLTGTTLESVEEGLVRLAGGRELPADTVVWTAGVRPHPLAARSGLPVDEAGRVLVDEYLRVRDTPGAWAAGDCAAVPDLTTGGHCPPTAQHAVRQARRLARNLVAVLEGREPRPFRYRMRGQLASLGRHRGVAEVYGLGLHGFWAWWLHRTYHLLRMPTLNRKVRIAMDWTVGLLFPREVVQLGSLRHPEEPLQRAAGP